MFISQADGVGASRRVVDGRAGGFSHGPFVPHLLSVVAPPEPHRDVIVPGYGDGLLLEGGNKKEKNINVRKHCNLVRFKF